MESQKKEKEKVNYRLKEINGKSLYKLKNILFLLIKYFLNKIKTVFFSFLFFFEVMSLCYIYFFNHPFKGNIPSNYSLLYRLVYVFHLSGPIGPIIMQG